MSMIKCNRNYILTKHNNDFTISFEFELETDDEYTPESEDESIIIDQIRCSVFNQLRDDNEQNVSFINDIINGIELDDDDFTFGELLVPDNFDGLEKKYIELIRAISMEYSSDNLSYLINKVKEFLPNFYDKWSDKMKFEIDNSLDRGIEFSHITHIPSLCDSINLLDNFYRDFNNQTYWKFTEKTGLHINIGFKDKKKWNVLKGFLFLNDNTSTNLTPYVFKGIEYRMKSKYSGSFREMVLNTIKENKDTFNLNKNDIFSTELFLNDFLMSIQNNEGYESPRFFKLFGFNITRISSGNYIEFRYPGGNMTKTLLIDKLKYFSYLCLLMVNSEYNKQQYYRQLYKFLSFL